ncbi:MAG TPA: hypothetical protein PKX87_02615 [Alphaproteobacteria bacterium]|nr:hypothetical protein [Alphaproteobacteria bacterium]
MYLDDKWTPVTGEELAGFLSQIDPIDGKHKVSAQSTRVHWRMLPFYDQVALIRVQDPNWINPRLNVYYLTEQGNLYRLNGTSPPIHEVNAKAPVRITEENVLDYLRFFCFFVRGEEGPFLVAEDLNDPYLPRDADEKTRMVIQNTVHPATFEGKNAQGHFLCDAVVFYSNALFLANFAVQPGGMIEMTDDEPVAADLTSRVDAPIA